MQCVQVCSFEEHGDEEHEEDEHNHEGVDPHIWLSPMQVKKQVDTIAQTLSEEDPENAQTYKKNADEFKKQLDELHFEIETKLSELKTDKLMVFHPAWGYFADEYGLKQIAIEQSGKEPSAEQLQNIIDEAKEENIKVIFVQSQFNKEIAESVAEEIGAIVVSIDPLSEDYVANLKNVATTISESLNN
jgi:zinc transport system substrate-binding protein